MKKFAALLLALVLAATMCIGAMAEAVDYTGTWVLAEIRSGEYAFDPASMGMDMTIVLDADGTCTLTTMGMTESGLWVGMDGGIWLTDSTGATDSIAYVDGNLVLAAEGIEMILVRSEAAEYEYAEILGGLTMADFAGTWVLEHVETTYGVYAVADLGAEMTATITAEGTAVIEMFTAEGTLAYNAICETEEADGLGTIMWASFLGEDGQPDGTGMMFLLYDDGQLVWYEYDSTEGMECEYFYCFNLVTE